MTVTEKQAWLWRYQKARPRMDQLEGRLQRQAILLEEMMEAAAGPCHPSRRKRLEGEMNRIRREMAAGKEALAQLELDRQEIAAAIERVQDPRYRQLLAYHYLSGWPWQQVACRMEYGSRYIYKLHKQALEAIECKGRKRRYHLTAPGCRMHCFPQGEVEG